MDNFGRLYICICFEIIEKGKKGVLIIQMLQISYIVLWCAKNIFAIRERRFQEFTSIYNKMSNKNNVENNVNFLVIPLSSQ